MEKLPPIIEARAREMADLATTPARRAELELELADLERQLARHAADVDSVATGQGFVAAEGISAGKALAKSKNLPELPDPNGKASDGVTSLGDYIWRLNKHGDLEVVNRGDGPKLLYDENSRKFVPDPQVRDNPSFGATTTRAEAYEALGGREPESDFGRFTHMLVAEGIVSGHEAIIASMQDPATLRYETVQRNLRKVYAQAVVDTITDPTRLQATPLFQVLRRRGVAPEDALAQASHAEMLRVTRNLGSSYSGTVAERWYEAAFGPASAKQVTITPEQASAAGTSISTTRRLDRVSGWFIEELKNVSGRLDAEDKAQIEDQLRLVDRDIPLGEGKVQHVSYLKVSMLDPEGVLANAGYMYDRLDPSEPRASELMFEIWSSRGTSLLVTTENRAILNDPAKLKAYLAYGTVR